MKKIYVRFPNWVGDVVMALPFLSLLRGIFPNARISVVVRAHLEPLLWGNKDLSEVIPITRKDEHSLSGLSSWVLRIKEKNFDSAFVLPPSFSSSLPVFLARIPERIGWNTDGRGLLLNRKAARDKPVSKRKLSVQYTDLIKRISETELPDIPLPEINVTDRHLELARTAMQRCNISAHAQFVAVNASASYGRAKNWLPWRYAAVIDRLKQKIKCSVVLTGGPGDRSYLEEVKACTNNSVDGVFTGSVSGGVGELIGILSQAALLISNDTGAAHVAAAIGRPVITIFGSTSPLWTSPQGDNVRILYNPPECSPCYRKKCPLSRHLCMENITVRDVVNAAVAILKKI